MSKGMKTLAVNSGLLSCYFRDGLTGLIAQNSTIELWELPTGARIIDGYITRDALDTTNTADVVVESMEAAPKTFLSLDISAATIADMVRTAANVGPITGTHAQRRVRLRNTAAGTGDGAYSVMLVATRPGPEPGASA